MPVLMDLNENTLLRCICAITAIRLPVGISEDRATFVFQVGHSTRLLRDYFFLFALSLSPPLSLSLSFFRSLSLSVSIDRTAAMSFSISNLHFPRLSHNSPLANVPRRSVDLGGFRAHARALRFNDAESCPHREHALFAE
jgi:hypothetical protein